MALHKLLDRGVRALLDEHRGELEAFVVDRGLDVETAVHLQHALEAMPGLLLALDGALYHGEAPPAARTLFNSVLRYLLLEDDAVPAREGRALVGHLDDLYLLHRAAQTLRAHVADLDFRSIDGGAQLLAQVLPPQIVSDLDDVLTRALEDA